MPFRAIKWFQYLFHIPILEICHAERGAHYFGGRIDDAIILCTRFFLVTEESNPVELPAFLACD